ncbi:hypothetical protein ACGFZQ_12170 [Streptomyces sp. NPDC048254]|uniref:hypothetical protein n=1 Tax=Streptomyces sp. NPDC048254 TaxID=3365525 RepID=UPI003716E9DE
MATTYPRDLLTALYKRRPYSVEPMEAWQRPEGYWLTTSRAYPDFDDVVHHDDQVLLRLGEPPRRCPRGSLHSS